MKRIAKQIIVGVALLLTSTAVASCITTQKGKSIHIEGFREKGIMLTKSIEVPDYTKLEVHRGIEVVLSEELPNQLTVTADEHLMPYVVVTCRLGTLEITIDSVLATVGDRCVRVELPSNPNITLLRTSSAAEVCFATPLVTDHKVEVDASSSSEVKGTIHAPELTMSLSSAAEADLNLEVPTLAAHISSSASAELKGKCDKASLLTTSASELDAEELITQECEVNASSASSVELHCTKLLRAEASSAASVKYSGPCVTEVMQSSAGSVRKSN